MSVSLDCKTKTVSTSWAFPHPFPERCQGVAWFPAWKTAQYDGDFLLCCVSCVQSELFYLGAILENSLRENKFSPTFPPWHIFWPSCLCLCSYLLSIEWKICEQASSALPVKYSFIALNSWTFGTVRQLVGEIKYAFKHRLWNPTSWD